MSYKKILNEEKSLKYPDQINWKEIKFVNKNLSTTKTSESSQILPNIP